MTDIPGFTTDWDGLSLAPKIEGLTYCKQDHACQSLQAILTSNIDILVHPEAR